MSKLWTEKDISLLKELYPQKPAKECAEILNRPVQGIRTKASRLGIKRLNSRAGVLKTKEEYDFQIAKLNKVTRQEPYKGAQVKILHSCNFCRYKWLLAPTKALIGRGCPKCNNSGFKDDKPGILYLVRFDIDQEEVYKLGITNNSPKQRLEGDFIKFHGDICWEIFFPIGKNARDMETYLKHKYKEHQYNTERLKSGNTETFDIYINKPEV